MRISRKMQDLGAKRVREPVDFAEWAHPKNHGTYVTRAELMAWGGIFEQAVVQPAILNRLRFYHQALRDRRWYRRLWRWLTSTVTLGKSAVPPVVAMPAESPDVEGDSEAVGAGMVNPEQQAPIATPEKKGRSSDGMDL